MTPSTSQQSLPPLHSPPLSLLFQRDHTQSQTALLSLLRRPPSQLRGGDDRPQLCIARPTSSMQPTSSFYTQAQGQRDTPSAAASSALLHGCHAHSSSPPLLCCLLLSFSADSGLPVYRDVANLEPMKRRNLTSVTIHRHNAVFCIAARNKMRASSPLPLPLLLLSATVTATSATLPG